MFVEIHYKHVGIQACLYAVLHLEHSPRRERVPSVRDPFQFLMVSFFQFFLGGKGRKCVMHRNAFRRRVWDSSAVSRWALIARWTFYRLTYPLKPPHAGLAGHIPSSESHYRACFAVEIGGSSFGPCGFDCPSL